MKKSQVLQVRENYLQNQKDDGRNGKAFEIDVKLFLNNKIATKTAVASAGKIDTTYHKVKIEIKSGCGEITDILKNDYVVYSPDSAMENARVYTSQEFWQILENCGLIRDKKTSKGTMVKAIQSFKNSQKKNMLFRAMLENNGLSLVEFKQL